jgi:hypothetical protein
MSIPIEEQQRPQGGSNNPLVIRNNQLKSNLMATLPAPKPLLQRKNLTDLAPQEPWTRLLKPRNLSQKDDSTEIQSHDEYDLILEYLLVGLNHID